MSDCLDGHGEDHIRRGTSARRGIIHQPEGETCAGEHRAVQYGFAAVSTMNRERIMSIYLDGMKDKYDYILLDCMPEPRYDHCQRLTADSVIIPDAGALPAIEGMTQLTKTINKVQRQLNPKLKTRHSANTCCGEYQSCQDDRADHPRFLRQPDQGL